LVLLPSYDHALIHALDFLEGGPWFDNRHEAWPVLPGDLREEVLKEQSRRMSGQNHPLFGKFAEAHPRFGGSHSEEHKEKMSNLMKGSNNPMFGKPGNRKGKTHTAEAKQKIKKARAKQITTEETKQKMSETRKNNTNARYKQKWWVNDKNKRIRSNECPGPGWQNGIKWRTDP
jgi:hypothetical protein